MKLQVLTNSEGSTFRGCPMRHHLAYRLRLRPVSTHVALRAGTAYHAGAEASTRALFETFATTGDRQEAIGAARITGQMAADLSLTKQVAAVPRGDARDRAHEEALELRPVLEWMIRHLVEVTHTDLDRFVLVAIEDSFDFPIPRADGRGGSVHLLGKRDLTVFDKGSGDLVVVEHKQAKVLHGFERRLELDPQTTGYLEALRYAARRGKVRAFSDGLLEGAQIRNAPIGRVLYRVMRRAKPSEPKINQDGTVSVAACDTTAELLSEALAVQQRPEWLTGPAALIEQHIRDGKLPSPALLERGRKADEKWEALVDRQQQILATLEARGDTFYVEHERMITERMIERWRSDQLATARLIRQADRDPALRVRNTDACTLAHSPRCAYRSPCLDPESESARVGFRVAETPHEELLDEDESEGEAT